VDRPARSILVALFLLGSLAVLPQPRAAAANYTPATVADLIADITAANASSENDVIDLGGQTFTLTTVNNITDGNNGLPSILSSATAGELTIQNGTIKRSTAGGTPNFRILEVASGGVLHLDHVLLSNGNAGANNGGAVDNLGSLSVASSTISNNTTSADGGGLFSGGSITVGSSTISNNVASGEGGGLYYGAAATVFSSTIALNNAAGNGGGIGNTVNGAIRLFSSTIAGNSTSATGGGISGGGVSLISVIVANNTATVTSPDSSGTFASESHNLIGNGSGTSFVNGVNNDIVGTTSNPIDPMLGGLVDNGGPTSTMALGPTSLAINNGANPLALQFDQRGAPRSVGGQPDIGAFEVFVPHLAVTLAGTGSGSVTSSPSGISCPSTCSSHPPFDSGVQLTAHQDPGSVFDGWSGDCTGTGTCDLDMTTDKSVTATFRALPGVTISNVRKTEGDSGTKRFVFHVTLSSPAVGGETLDYATAAGTANRTDFVPTSGTLTFAAGQTIAPIVVLVKGDRNVERNETFLVRLSNPSGLVLVDPKGVGVIVNDDSPPPPPCSGVCSG